MEKVRLETAIEFDVELERILGKEAKIYKEAYHGSTINSVVCMHIANDQSNYGKSEKNVRETNNNYSRTRSIVHLRIYDK